MVYKEVGGGCAEALVEVEKAEDSDEHLLAKEVCSRDAADASLDGDSGEHLPEEAASSGAVDAGLVGDTAEYLPAKEGASSGAVDAGLVSPLSSSNSDPVEVSESLLSTATIPLL